MLSLENMKDINFILCYRVLGLSYHIMIFYYYEAKSLQVDTGLFLLHKTF